MPCRDDLILDVIHARRWLHAEGIEVKQRLDEVLLSFDWIADRRDPGTVRRVVEIGTLNGGWSLMASRVWVDATFTLIDPNPRPELAQVTAEIVRGWPQGHECGLALIERKSQNVAGEIAPGIDVLHVDGLHRSPQPRIDWGAYRPIMADNSFVIFHDTKLGGVAETFHPLLDEYEGAEFIGCEGKKGIGVGVLHIPKGGPAA